MHFRAIARVSQSRRYSRAPKFPSDTRQCGQLLAFRTFWKQEQEHKVDRFPVERIEIDRLPKANKHAERFIDFWKSRVRYCYAVSYTRGAKLFTLGQFCKYTLWWQPKSRSGFARQLKEQLLFVRHGYVDRRVISREKVCDVHESISLGLEKTK
jgi:hypothetical protein